MKKNKLIAKEYGLDRHHYLEKLGLNIRECGTNFCDNTDERYPKWMKERRKYGFDSRETWCMDKIADEWLYEHLKMFLKRASTMVDLDDKNCMFEVDGDSGTLRDWIVEMIELLEIILLEDEEIDRIREVQHRVWTIWAEVIPWMWW